MLKSLPTSLCLPLAGKRSQGEETRVSLFEKGGLRGILR